jgi:TonB family protein
LEWKGCTTEVVAGFEGDATLLDMKKCRTGWLLLALTVARIGCAQTNAKDLEKELKGKPLGLRSYSAEPVAHYDWDGDKIVAVPGQTFAVGVFTASSVKLKNGVVALTGKRALVVRDSGKNILASIPEVPMRLEVDLHGALESKVLSKIKDMLFAADLPDLIGDLPAPLKEELPFDVAAKTAASSCHCSHILQDGRWTDVETKGNVDFTFPRVVAQTSPEMSDEALKHKVSGAVVVVVFVDDLGQVGNVWIGESPGYGLDEKAVAAVRTYKFEPATYKGKAVGVAFKIEINFQIF